MNTTTTRRTALAALGMAAFIPTVAVALPLNDRSAWTLAVARYRAATDALTRANAAHSDAEGQYFGSKPARPVFVLEQDGDYGRFGRHVLPLTIDHDELDDPDRVWAEPERVEQFRRTLAGYRSADATLRRELDLDCLEDASVTAMEEQIDAIRHLIALPAPDMTAIMEKIAIILAEYDDTDGATAAVLADVRRFAGEARA